MKTPTSRRSQGDGVEQEKTSGKKLVQARLPFKILSTSADPSGVTAEKTTAKESVEARKRKLSYEEEEAEKSVAPKRRSVRGIGSKEDAKQRKDIIKETAAKKTVVANVVLLDSDDGNDDCNDANDSVCKENATAKEKRISTTNLGESLDIQSDDVELIESTDEDEAKVSREPKGETATPKTSSIEKSAEDSGKSTSNSNKKTIQKNNSKPSTTPQSAKKSTGKGRKSAGDAPSSSKLQIKLPTATKKNKRRKQGSMTAENVTDEQEHLHDENESDDIEIISKELHPEKRQKLDVSSNMENQPDDVNKQQVAEKIDNQSSNAENEDTKDVKQVEKLIAEKVEDSKEKVKPKKLDKDQSESAKESSPAFDVQSKPCESENAESEIEQSKSKICDISSTTSDLEADTETTFNSEQSPRTNTRTRSHEIKNKTDETTSNKITGDSTGHKMQKKNLTPKQQKLVEQRLKARGDKERKIQEERLQKQREKEERESTKKREREEKEEQRRKEREEKEELRRKEREEKEQKRLADIEAKNEEKRKRTEAKEEEQRKKEEERKKKEQEKEDERKRKEQEKEEAEMKKKKAALAFTKFFSRPAQETTGQRIREKDVAEDNNELLAFRPFQIKGDMKLAPIVRKQLSDAERSQLTAIMRGENSMKSYLNDLKNGAIKPYKWTRPIQNENDPTVSIGKDDDNDVVIVEDELERAGQAIVEEHNVPIEHFRARFYKFAENRRPPYYGTWRKKSKIVTARRPFAQDKQFFDYEVDSDDEWEEEEPGESLDGSDDDKEKESEDEDYEVDNEWFVPHGHLSEEEMQNEDDLAENNDREAQKAKLKILQQEFAQEMKKKTEKIKPRLIGCIWVDENGNRPESCPKIIWDTLNERSILCAEPPIMEEIKSEKKGDANIANGQTGERNNGETKLKPITLTESMLKQLVKLVHGNTHSKNFLIREYIAYIEANEESVRNGDVRGPLKSVVREKIEEFAHWQAVEAGVNSNENNKGSKTPKSKKKLCWVVTKDTLQKMNLDNIELNNNWQYILEPRIRPKAARKEVSITTTSANGENSKEHSETSADNVASGNATEQKTPVHNKTKRNPDIKKFTKVLTTEEKALQLQKQKEQQIKTPIIKDTTMTSPTTTKITPKSNAGKSNSKNETPTVKKRVPLLISVARGQSISTPDKNARISEFLKTINAKEKQKQNTETTALPMETDDIVVLE